MKRVNLCTNDPNVHIRIFRKRCRLILRCFFPVNILKPRIGKEDMKHQKQKGYQTQLYLLYQEANIKNFEKTCIPCRLYHLLNITGKIITTVSFPKVFTVERSDGKYFSTTSFLRLKLL